MQLVEVALCHCGCGELTPLARQTSARNGWVKGEPTPFVNAGHSKRLRELWEERDCGYTSPCWVFLGAVSTGGYGRLRVGSRPARLAHRVIFERHRGPIPEGLQLDHLCRNRACVNPDHLEPVTHVENIRRGVSANGIKTHCPQGHAYDPENTHVRANGGGRVCKTCRREGNNRRYHERIEAEALR